eukprot:EG_transcript_33997
MCGSVGVPGLIAYLQQPYTDVVGTLYVHCGGDGSNCPSSDTRTGASTDPRVLVPLPRGGVARSGRRPPPAAGAGTPFGAMRGGGDCLADRFSLCWSVPGLQELEHRSDEVHVVFSLNNEAEHGQEGNGHHHIQQARQSEGLFPMQRPQQFRPAICTGREGVVQVG